MGPVLPILTAIGTVASVGSSVVGLAGQLFGGKGSIPSTPKPKSISTQESPGLLAGKKQSLINTTPTGLLDSTPTSSTTKSRLLGD